MDYFGVQLLSASYYVEPRPARASDAREYDQEDFMITIETSIDIQRPVEVVFAYVTDQRNIPQWEGAVKEVQVIPDGPPVVGTKIKTVGTFLGVKLEGAFEVTSLEPNRSFTYRGGAGPAVGETTMRFEAAGNGTRLSGTLQMEPGGLFKMAEPLLVSQAKKQLEADGQRLKNLLEAQHG
jgi:uncharacterized membrane protein